MLNRLVLKRVVKIFISIKSFATVLNRLVPKLNQFKISPNESFATSIKMAINLFLI